MDLKQLFTVGDTSSPSASQLWFHLTNLAILVVYLFVGYKVGMMIREGIPNASALLDSLIFLTLVISGIITSNKFANVLVNLKYGNNKNVDDSSKSNKSAP